MRDMKLLYIRHAESVANAQGVIAGQSNVEISGLGRLQLNEICKKLALDKPDIIYSSDLIRAKDTAEFIHTQYPTVPLVFTAQLRGRDYGSIEGKVVSVEEREAFYQSMYKMDFHPPGIESVTSFYKRNLEFINKIFQDHKDQSVAVVAHASNGRIITALADDIPIKEIGIKVKMPSPAEVRTFMFKDLAFSINNGSCRFAL